MHGQVFRRRQQISYKGWNKDDTPEEDMYMVQAQLSDIGSIRELPTKASYTATEETETEIQQEGQEDTKPSAEEENSA
tara:strand:+ start:461 stop:694 length:234 start_codon:yes stop_codon:yes gene_type:complete